MLRLTLDNAPGLLFPPEVTINKDGIIYQLFVHSRQVRRILANANCYVLVSADLQCDGVDNAPASTHAREHRLDRIRYSVLIGARSPADSCQLSALDVPCESGLI